MICSLLLIFLHHASLGERGKQFFKDRIHFTLKLEKKIHFDLKKKTTFFLFKMESEYLWD